MALNKNICDVCKVNEIDVNQLIFCEYCFSSGHFKCRNISGKAVQRMKQNTYFCSIDCSDKYIRIIDMQKQKTSISRELGDELRTSVATELNSVKENVRSITSAIESNQDFLSAKFDEILFNFKNLKQENLLLKQEIEKLKMLHSTLSTTAYKIESDLDKPAKAAVSNHAVVLGIPYKPKENITKIVNKMFSEVNVEPSPESILSIERMHVMEKSSCSLIPVRVTFKDEVTKENVLRKAKVIKNISSTKIDPSLTLHGKATKICIRHELSPLSVDLLKEVRKYKQSLNLKYIWAGKNGAIFVRKSANEVPFKITNRNDFSRFVAMQQPGKK